MLVQLGRGHPDPSCLHLQLNFQSAEMVLSVAARDHVDVVALLCSDTEGLLGLAIQTTITNQNQQQPLSNSNTSRLEVAKSWWRGLCALSVVLERPAAAATLLRVACGTRETAPPPLQKDSDPSSQTPP
eukprot:CAMPEP_0194740502 /NCGR_PEP_ID=MMETSP0296-20130528/92703_1 /TAXON_ID=39354 /ORGANISM="Heterosigma akashiwo, Strain CCMP2393" /LENGTH=128 /DNA_ID=CAMNT_0039651663 /DNA_START=142 /DNA_END=524 /DNA_ORIENTATION=-